MTTQIQDIPQGYTQSQRTYTNVETGEQFDLFTHYSNHAHKLISEDRTREATRYYLSAFADLQIKLNGTKIVTLQSGTFYELKEGEKITHRKFFFESRFRKA